MSEETELFTVLVGVEVRARDSSEAQVLVCNAMSLDQEPTEPITEVWCEKTFKSTGAEK